MPVAPTVDFLIVAVYLGMILAVAFKAARRRGAGAEDYILAGRTLTLPLFVASLVTSFYGGVFGVGEFTWRSGVSNWLVMGVPYYLFAAVYAFFFAGKIRTTPGMTLPDHLEAVYGRGLAAAGAFLLFLMMSPADEVLMLGTLLSWAAGLPKIPCLAAAAVLGVLVIYRGGLRAGVWTNVLQLLVMFGGFSLILPYAYRELGGLTALRVHLPETHLQPTGGLPLGYLLTWYFIAFWTIIDPMFHQRVSAAQDPKTARDGILVSIAFWCVFDFMTTSAGLYARALLPDLQEPMLAYPMLAERLLPPVVRGLFMAGMMSSMVAALDSALLVSGVLLARDLFRREDRMSWAVAAAGGLGLALAFLIPSVVQLWYAAGSVVNPALLLPVLSVYVPALRVPRGWALASCLGGFMLAAAWLAESFSAGAPPFGVEAMYPGFALSSLIWAAGWLTRPR